MRSSLRPTDCAEGGPARNASQDSEGALASFPSPFPSCLGLGIATAPPSVLQDKNGFQLNLIRRSVRELTIY